MIDLLTTLIVFIIVFGILVVLHELGHFLTARRFGIGVHEFAFGMPPRIKAWRKGETEYAINAVPIGGYVRLLGEDEEVDDPASFQKKPAWQRLIVLAAGSVVHLLLAVMLFSIILFIQGKPIPNDKVQIISVVESSPAAEAGERKIGRSYCHAA